MNLSVDTIRLRIQSMPPYSRGRRELEGLVKQAKHDDLYSSVLAQELALVLAREDWGSV